MPPKSITTLFDFHLLKSKWFPWCSPHCLYSEMISFLMRQTIIVINKLCRSVWGLHGSICSVERDYHQYQQSSQLNSYQFPTKQMKSQTSIIHFVGWLAWWFGALYCFSKKVLGSIPIPESFWQPVQDVSRLSSIDYWR